MVHDKRNYDFNGKVLGCFNLMFKILTPSVIDIVYILDIINSKKMPNLLGRMTERANVIKFQPLTIADDSARKIH